MRYVGGKQRIAKRIAEVILETSSGRETYLEPFVGGGAVGAILGSRFDFTAYADAHEDLVLMWQALERGEDFPEALTRAEWENLRESPPSALRGLAGFGGSFSGKWFAGYAKGGHNANGQPRNHYGESLRRARRDIEGMRGRVTTSITRRSFEDTPVWPGCVVYADPPYRGTLGYGSSFDHDAFWATAAWWSAQGADVYVSEYDGPAWAEVLLEVPLRVSTTTTEQGRVEATERLFRIPPI